VVEVGPGEVDPARLADCQRDARDGRYAGALAGFVRWLAPRYGEVRAGLAAERAAARDAFTAGAPHARTPAAVGDLMVGLDYFLRFAREVGAVTASEAEASLVRGRAALSALATEQADHLRAGDPVEQFLRLIPAVLLSGQAHLSAPAGGPPDRPDASGWRRDENTWFARGNRIGWADGETVYLDPDAAYGEAQRLATTQREPLTMSPRTLWKRLHERNLLSRVEVRAGKTRFAARTTLGGERVDVLHLHRRTLFPGCGGDPSGPPPVNDVETPAAGRATPRVTRPGSPGEWPIEWPAAEAGTSGSPVGVGHSGHSPGPRGNDDVEEFTA
jgi:hypothetical protein